MSKQTKIKALVLGAILLLGGGDFTATWVRGEHGKALPGFLLLAVVVLAMFLAGRSERLRRQLFDTDERSNAITLFAGAWTGFTLFLVLYVSFLVEFARGHSGEPYFWLSGLSVGLFSLLALARSFRR